MIQLGKETIRTFSEAARRLPAMTRGKPVNPATLFRWANVGLLTPGGNRVRLETIRIGRNYVTSDEAIDRFIAAINNQAANEPVPRSPADRRRGASAAARKLDQLGVGV